jgi:hypothetical protein
MGRILATLAGGWLLVACARTAPPMQVAETCRAGDLTLQFEVGLAESFRVPPVCGDVLAQFQADRDLYQARFGRIDLTEIPVRLRTAVYLDGDGHTGEAYVNAIDLGVTGWRNLPHELNHVRTGYNGHVGWCVDFEPWSESVLAIDERLYLGCK